MALNSQTPPKLRARSRREVTLIIPPFPFPKTKSIRGTISLSRHLPAVQYRLYAGSLQEIKECTYRHFYQASIDQTYQPWLIPHCQLDRLLVLQDLLSYLSLAITVLQCLNELPVTRCCQHINTCHDYKWLGNLLRSLEKHEIYIYWH